MRYETKTRSMGRLGYVAMFVAVAMLTLLVLHQFIVLLDRPEVHVSYSTGQCVEVVDHKAKHEGKQSEWSCDKLPETYERIWVY